MTTRKVATKATRPHTPVNTNLSSIEGWNNLPKEDQGIVRDEATALDVALEAEGKAKLEVGEHLYNIQEVLTKTDKRIFTRFLESLQRNFSRATAYRYIDMYTAAKNLLPGPVMEQAMLRGTNRLNVRRIEATPPPRTNDPIVINEYLSEMERPQSNVPLDVTPDDLKRECVNHVLRSFERLPRAGRVRPAWIRSVVAMCLFGAGITTTETITPVAIPESFTRPRGRPKKTA